MSFLSPLFLVGLPLLAVPVVIHLLSRRQQKRISWGAMQFLIQAATRKRRLWRLTDLLLLLLRTAAFLLFILALARPLLPATWLGGSVPRDIILVLDQSLSMSRREGGASLFELQLQQASTVLDNLNSSDTIRVQLAGESPEWLSPEALPASGSTLRRLRQQLNDLRPTLGAADLISSVREAADLQAPKDKAARVIFVISDGQRFGWRLDEDALWASVRDRVQQASIPTAVNVHLIDSAEPEGNLSVSGLDTGRAFGALGQSLTFTALIQNHGTKPSSSTLLTWRVDDQSIGVTTVPELAAGAGTRLSIAHPFDATGTFELSCALEETDVLPADDQGQVLVEIFERLPILLVENQAEQINTPFIMAALGAPQPGHPQSGWRSVFEPTTVDGSALASLDLNPFRCVVLADMGPLAPAVIEKLERYVQNGGGLWMALGASTTPAIFNDQFHRGGLGLAPLKLQDPIGDPSDPETFVAMWATSEAHPATALLADFQRLDLDRVRVYRRHQFDPFSGRDVSVLLQASGGEPLAVERRLGRGRVLVQAVPLGVSWSTLPLCQVYVALLHEWLWYLSEPSLTKRNLAVGEALIEPAPSQRSQAELFLPDGRTLELVPSLSTGLAQFRYLGTRLPGPYALRLADQAVVQNASTFYVRRTPEESDLKMISDTDRKTLQAADSFSLNSGLDVLDTAGDIRIAKHPLEGWLLTALALVLLGELAVAGWTTHQRRLRVKPVTM